MNLNLMEIKETARTLTKSQLIFLLKEYLDKNENLNDFDDNDKRYKEMMNHIIQIIELF